MVDYEIAHVAFLVVDQNELEFSEALSLLSKKVSTEDLARYMLDLGFTVMNANYTRDDTFEVIKEYSRIMCPYDLPMSVLVKALRQIIRGNGDNRRDGPLGGDLETLATEHRKRYATHDQSQDVVQGYWSKGNNASNAPSSAAQPYSGGSLFAALDAMESTPASASTSSYSSPPPPVEEETLNLDDLTQGGSLFAALDEYERRQAGSS